ncbi:MAG TPA: response regulator [Candidatus Acidoferrales bacterium]|nr:response regulator [Candidatus Acidoferrales bacterium]
MPTILVADDNSNIQKMVGIALKDQGIDVIAVGNGEAAVRKLAESIPDLILADIFMPVRNGYEVCEYVKKDDRFAHIPVVLLVGAFDPLDEHEVERVHANGVLKKPFVPPDPLIEMVKSLLKPVEAPPTDTQRLEEDEDVQQTQDVGLAAHSPTGTMRIPAPEIPVTERTQRMPPAAPVRSGTVEVKRPTIPPADKTQPITPEGAPATAEGFKLDLAEPAPAAQVEQTQQLSSSDISKILKRESSLTAPKEEEEEDEFRVSPPVVEFEGGQGPLAFEDLLEPAEEEGPKGGSNLGLAAFDTVEEDEVEEEEEEEAEEQQEEEDRVAEIHFGGVREEAKTPDPERPPIPVDFDNSEPLEIITEEHSSSSEVHFAPAENLVASHSGWATPPAGAHAPEPDLVSEGHQEFPPPAAPPPAAPPAAATSAMMGGIAREAVAPAPEFTIAAERASTAIPVDEFDETTDLPKHILQEEVNRAQEIAARVAAQNREFIAQQEASGIPVSGPGIDMTISAVDTLLARHRSQVAAEEFAPEAAAAPALAPAPSEPAAAAAPQLTPEMVSPTVRVSRPANPDMVEAISDRVLAQLDPYIIEKIAKEIVRPMVEAMIRRELEKIE